MCFRTRFRWSSNGGMKFIRFCFLKNMDKFPLKKKKLISNYKKYNNNKIIIIIISLVGKTSREKKIC